jgi:hypothetical protein
MMHGQGVWRGLIALSAACVMWLGVASQASADTPIHGVTEIKLGGYYPAIDDEFGGAGPFADYFGEDWLWYAEMEWDVYLFQRFGKTGLAGHIGYSSVTGNVKQQGDAAATSKLGETSFRILPLRVSGVYRYDYSAIHHGFPLVPVVKAGLDYYLWRVTDAGGKTASAGDAGGSGGRLGWHAAFALHVLLDVVDPGTAATFDMNWGVNNSYFFAEYMITRIDGFGGEGLDLSDDMWMFGLAFEF